MTKTQYIQAILAGSFMQALLTALSKEDQVKGSVARLRQKLHSKLRDAQKDLDKVATDAYNAVKENHKDDGMEIDVGITVEAVATRFHEPLSLLYGKDFDAMVSRASMKVTVPNLTKKQGRDSWDIAHEFKESIQKHTFNYLMEK